jgi:cytochrome c oxidase subunit II
MSAHGASWLGGIQSALDPDSPEARAVADLAWLMFAGAGAILLLVVVLTLVAWRGGPVLRGWMSGEALVLGGGIILPVVTLSALLVYGLLLLRDASGATDPHAIRVEVVGHQFWWRVRYPADARGQAFETANEIHIPAGRDVLLRLRSADVIHSFWVPRLAGKLDMIPGQVNELRLRADSPGRVRGQCAEFCGSSHAAMAFDVVVHEAPAFAAWLEAQRLAAVRSSDPFAQRGATLFRDAGCGGCHTVRGTEADGELGPDLTHVASRRTIAAGTLPTHVGTLAGWIADAQGLKPGNRMPAFRQFTGLELRALATYLASLE